MTRSSVSPIRAFVNSVREDVREHREAVAAYRALQRELSVYTTSHEVDDLLGVIKDQEGPEAQMVRDILLDNLGRNARFSNAA